MRTRAPLAMPPAFNRRSFLEKFISHLNHLKMRTKVHLSPMVELLIELLTDCVMSCCEQHDSKVDAWTKALVMSAVVEIEDDALADYRKKLQGDAEFWPMVKTRWKLNCWDLGHNLETELPKYLKAQPVCSAEQFETLRRAIVELSPEQVLGEDYCKALNEPFMVTTFEERTEALRFANALLDLLLTQWPKREQGADPWAPPPEPEQDDDRDPQENFFGPGSRAWLKAIAKTAAPDSVTATAAPGSTTQPAASAESAMPVADIAPPSVKTRRASRRAAARAVIAPRRLRAGKRAKASRVQGDAS